MLTGLYPAGHGVHENARFLGSGHAVLAEQLRRAGYRTAAFVSSFVLSRRFGLSRGFEQYDDEVGGGERARRGDDDGARARLPGAAGCVRAAVPLGPLLRRARALQRRRRRFRDRDAQRLPRRGALAVDEQLGRLTQAFERAAAGRRDDRRRRSRRRARRARRGAARPPALSVDDARAAGDRRDRASRPATSGRPVSTRRVFSHGARLGRARRDDEPARRRPRGRARRGDEAVPRIRMAAADDGGERRR